jgi:HAE1 family hydrophobic/amphiphilic exporter-1
VNGQKRFAVRVRMRPDALAARNLTMDDVATALKAANANTPGGHARGQRQTLTIQANKQMTRAAEFSKIIIATLPSGNTRAPRGRGRRRGQRRERSRPRAG